MRKLYLIIGVLIVSVYSALAQAPKVSLSTVSVSETLTAGETRPISIQLTNTGNRDLQWQMAPASVTFSKANYANYLLPESQDRITDEVWITRANSEGLFNAAKQDDFGDWDAGSPLGTRWAAGYTHNPQTAYLPYMDLCQVITALCANMFPQ